MFIEYKIISTPKFNVKLINSLYLILSMFNLTTVNVPKFQTLYFIYFSQIVYSVHLFHKILSGLENSVDPDQTA